MTLADISISSLFYLLAYNDAYDNQHIMQAVMAKYPRLTVWAEQMHDDFAEFFKTQPQVAF